jgi:hypothetical protein
MVGWIWIGNKIDGFGMVPLSKLQCMDSAWCLYPNYSADTVMVDKKIQSKHIMYDSFHYFDYWMLFIPSPT